MARYHGWKQRRTSFALPMTITFSICRKSESGPFIAHALDFDLVAVSEEKDEALKRLRSMVKAYVEFGLSQGWEEDINFRAPNEYWEYLTPETPVSLMEPIVVQDDRPQQQMVVVLAQQMARDYHSVRPVAC